MTEQSNHPGYRPLEEASIRAFLETVPGIGARLGGNPGEWTVREVDSRAGPGAATTP